MNKLTQKLQPKDLQASSGQYDSLKAFSSNQRQASYAMMLISALVVVSCLFTYEVFRMQRTMFEIVVLANENINVWRRIEKLVTFEPIDRRDGSLNERMAKRIQNEVARKLEESEDYERRIEQAMGESKTFFFCWTIA
ncbi:hypothetical protein [Roseibium sp. TrichSKD4]|uniref:hypothetical protein n=1 Tax=Roseibium sp. TrichSKD4 TaxID=744980 RepID=UPI001111C223|nr:hypothetical protein [Roseibium sp. TrichSKD4]